MRSARLVVLFLVVTASFGVTAASGQVQSRPTDAPIVTAENELWYAKGDPVQFAGNVYYRAGAATFFDGNRMVRTGNFNGIPLYADTTVEPYSLVFVPIGRGLMQPYERLRSGDLAGTVGSRAPSFPVAALPNGATTSLMAPSAPTSLTPLLFEQPTARIAAAGRGRVSSSESNDDDDAVTRPAVAAPPVVLTPAEMQAVRERVWIDFRGQKWVPAGAAVPLADSGLTRIDEYAGFPVYARQGSSSDTRIYVPALPGLVTPYDLKR